MQKVSYVIIYQVTFAKKVTLTKVVYMSFSFLQLAVGSRDLSQAEKEITLCKAEQIHKMFYSLDKLKPKTKTKKQFFLLLTFRLCYTL